MCLTVAKAYRFAKPIFLSCALRGEIGHWLFFETLSGILPWSNERHFQFKLYSDVSSCAWGGVFNPTEVAIVISDNLGDDQFHMDIVIKETLALANVLAAFSDHIRNSRVDVYVDNQAW